MPDRLGIFPGTFNPVTVAHLALATAALQIVDDVVFVLPRVFPHKDYSGASLEQRAELLRAATSSEPRFTIATTDRGLFIDIARELKDQYGPETRLSFLCGRDAAERIANWDYGRPGAWQEMLREFDLLVATRQGEYAGPCERITLDSAHEAVSASEVRRRIAAGEAWEHLVPAITRDQVREIYR